MNAATRGCGFECAVTTTACVRDASRADMAAICAGDLDAGGSGSWAASAVDARTTELDWRTSTDSLARAAMGSALEYSYFSISA